MTQPNQHSFTREQIRQWARTGGLTPERIAAIEAAAKKGNVTRDGAATESQPEAKVLPHVGGTEIPAQMPEVRMPKHQWIGWEIELERARRRGYI